MGAGRRGRAVLAALLAGLVTVLLAPSVEAHPRLDRGGALGEVWRTVLETPGTGDPAAGDANPFLTGACARFGDVVAPFSLGPAEITCRMRQGQTLLVVGETYEISTLESATPGADEETLRAEASALLVGRPVVRVDGHRVRLTKVGSGLVTARLPQPNLFGSPDASVDLVAVGWVTALRPGPGRHTVDITLADGTQVPTTHVVVERRHRR